MKMRDAPVLCRSWSVLGEEVLGCWDCVRVFEQLFCFRVVFTLDLLLVEEVLLLAFMVVELESMTVELVVKLMPADIVDGGRERSRRSIVSFWLARICGCRW